VKGRRRARSAALQALYEIDQSDHPLDRVIAGRLPEIFRSALATHAPAKTLPRVLELLGPPGDAMLENLTATNLEGLGLQAAAVQGILATMERLRPQADYFVTLVHGVTRNRDAIDAEIGRIAPEWPVEQMAPIDRNLLRIALWEIAGGSSPVRVAINEAVELARAYSGESARRLVNGALGTFVAEHHALQIEKEEAERT
jgi:N utilization substance protein B